MRLDDKLFEVEFNRPLFLMVRDSPGNTEVFHTVDESSSATRIATLRKLVGYITKSFVPDNQLFWDNQERYLNGSVDWDEELYHVTVNPFHGKSGLIVDGWVEGYKRAGDIRIPLKYVKEIKPLPVFYPELISNIP